MYLNIIHLGGLQMMTIVILQKLAEMHRNHPFWIFVRKTHLNIFEYIKY
jgi:hypothetical protein